MPFKIFDWSRILFIAAIIVTTYQTNVCAMEATDLSVYGEIHKSFIITKLPDTKDHGEERKKALLTIFSQPDVSLFDLTLSDVSDSDMENIFQGLVNRQAISEASRNGIKLKLIDLSNERITKTGMEHFLSLLQKGSVKPDGSKILPDMRQTICKVSPHVNLTEELMERWHRLAPSVFTGGLTLVE